MSLRGFYDRALETIELFKIRSWILVSIRSTLRPVAGGKLRRLRVGRGAARAEDALGRPIQSHISPNLLVFEDKFLGQGNER